MTIFDLDSTGLREASKRLSAGEAIAIPTPSPLAYIVIGTDPHSVNIAKGRSAEQPIGVLLASADKMVPALALAGRAAELATWLCFVEHTTLLAPVIADPPAALLPGVVDGLLSTAGAWLPELQSLIANQPHLYGSSANTTGREPATTALAAERAFMGRLLVLDGDSLRSPDVHHASTTTLEIDSAGSLSIRRPGVQDAAFGGAAEAYLADVKRRFASETIGRWDGDDPSVDRGSRNVRLLRDITPVTPRRDRAAVTESSPIRRKRS